MGRNRKVGLDWWPRDIGLYRDPKLRAARQKFGVLGPYVYECLLDIAYGDKGYYIAYSGEGREDTLWQLREYTAGLENVSPMVALFSNNDWLRTPTSISMFSPAVTLSVMSKLNGKNKSKFSPTFSLFI